MRITVAIDGPAAAGKGTVARAVAARFGMVHLDTGLLYRAVGARVLDGEDAVAAARALTPADLDRGDLRRHEVADAASQAAVIGEVRAALVAFQREVARTEGGAVLDGRDIGTVICPDAEVKLYVTASAEARAERRWKELREAGQDVDLATVLADVRARDDRDAGRAEAPMRAADDAVVIDTSRMDADAAIAAAVAAVRAAM